MKKVLNSFLFYLIIGTELGFQEMNILFYWSDFLTEYIVLVHIDNRNHVMLL